MQLSVRLAVAVRSVADDTLSICEQERQSGWGRHRPHSHPHRISLHGEEKTEIVLTSSAPGTWVGNPPARHRGLLGPSGPEPQKSPKRVREGCPAPGGPQIESPKSAPQSPKRVQKESEAVFLDSFRTAGRTFWGLDLGLCAWPGGSQYMGSVRAF